ncbi:MAG: RidA family protein [Chitinophagia bacterium]|nr:RidA family protein [Chitinophagia bacterium]
MKKILVLIILIGCRQLQAQTPEEKLQTAGYSLTKVTAPVANYVNVVRTGNLLFLAGKGPIQPDGKYVTGKLGKDLTIEQGYAAAQLTALAQLSVLKDYLGSLSRVKQIVKVLGLVNCTETFADQPKVVNGFSDIMVLAFGDKGKHARSAIGTNALPFGMAVEVELIVEIEKD